MNRGELTNNLIGNTLERHEELMKINGEHMSHIRADLTEVKNILVKNAEDTKTYRKTVDEHMARVEPIISAYENEKEAKEYLDSKGESIVKWSARIGAIGFIGSLFLYLLKKFL